MKTGKYLNMTTLSSGALILLSHLLFMVAIVEGLSGCDRNNTDHCVVLNKLWENGL